MTPDTPADGEALAFSFDRYVNGVLMAEGVTIERQPDLPSAMRAAARLASRGPNGETPVLVYRPAEPRRCAECDCEGGEMECNWMSRPAEPAQAGVDWEARRWEAMLAAMQGLCANPGGPVQANSHTGWDFVNCQSDGVAKVARSLADDLIAAAQEGRE